MSEGWVPSWSRSQPEPEPVADVDTEGPEPRVWWAQPEPTPAPESQADPPWMNASWEPPAKTEPEVPESAPEPEPEPERRRRGVEGGSTPGHLRQQSGRYAGVYQDGLRDDLSNGMLPLAYRVGVAALVHCWDDGHAPFPPSGLRRVLATVDRRTGDLTEPSTSTLARAIRTAKTEGWVESASTARCLIVPPERHRRGTGMRGDSRCTVH